MRISAVRRIETSESPEAVATGLGINRRTIYRWLAVYRYGCADGTGNWPSRYRIDGVFHDSDTLKTNLDHAGYDAGHPAP